MASSTAYWMRGLSTSGSISFGWAFVAGRNRVPRPAAGKTAFRTLGIIVTIVSVRTATAVRLVVWSMTTLPYGWRCPPPTAIMDLTHPRCGNIEPHGVTAASFSQFNRFSSSQAVGCRRLYGLRYRGTLHWNQRHVV